jgi:hypothetical protein
MWQRTAHEFHFDRKAGEVDSEVRQFSSFGLPKWTRLLVQVSNETSGLGALATNPTLEFDSPIVATMIDCLQLIYTSLILIQKRCPDRLPMKPAIPGFCV